MKKGFICLFAAMVLTFTLILCWEKNAHNAPDNVTNEGKESQLAQNVWNDSHVLLYNNLKTAVIKNSVIYGYYTDNENIMIAALDTKSGSNLQEIRLDGLTYVINITADEAGNVYVLGKCENKYVFWKIDSEGKITALDNFKLEDLDDEFENIPKGLYVDKNGNFYIWYEVTVPLKVFQEDAENDVYTKVDRIYVMDNQLNTLFYEQIPNSDGSRLLSFSFGQDEVPTILAQDIEGTYMLELQLGQKKNTSKIRIDEASLSEDCNNLAVIEGGFLFCEGSSLYKYMFNTQKSEKILDLSTYGVFPSDIIYMGMKDDAVEIVDNYGENGESEYLLLVEGESDKTELLLGVMQKSQELENIVTKFNRFSNDTRVEILTYYDGQNDFETALERLNLDIVRGQAADILDVFMIEDEILAEKGAFVDLYEYMEQDGECNKEMLMSNVLEAYELDSHLYSVAPAFQLYSMWGSNSVIKNKYGVTFNEIIKILKDNGKDINAIYGFSADEPVLTTMCAIGMDEFVDWKSGSCNFEGEGFQEVLRFAKEYSGGYTEGSLSDGIRNGSILLSVGIISDVADYKVQSELYGGEVSFIGYPTAEGSGTAVSFRGSQLAINAEGENKEAAWEFIKYYLLNGYQNEGFPVVKEQFDKIMSQAMEETYIVDSEEKYKAAKKVYYDSDAYIEIYKAEQKDVDAVKQLIKKADTKFAYHTNIQNIINEEAESYFKGQKELKEVTELIQNRVSLFLEEK